MVQSARRGDIDCSPICAANDNSDNFLKSMYKTIMIDVQYVFCQTQRENQERVFAAKSVLEKLLQN